MYAIATPLRGVGDRPCIAGSGRSLRELHAGCAGMSLAAPPHRSWSQLVCSESLVPAARVARFTSASLT
jgi:hypothetical protein